MALYLRKVPTVLSLSQLVEVGFFSPLSESMLTRLLAEAALLRWGVWPSEYAPWRDPVLPNLPQIPLCCPRQVAHAPCCPVLRVAFVAARDT